MRQLRILKVDQRYFYLLRRCLSILPRCSEEIRVRPINKLLIANRGEIACRVMRTAKKMGIRTVAVYSEVDAQSMHTQMADEAYCIGPASSSESYLKGDHIIEVALRAGAQAIHPGYGFLSENANFADSCDKAGLIFVGPPSSAIRDMGIKNTAKRIMEEAKVPVVKGYHGVEQDDNRLRQEAEKIGYPVMLKAVYGGGGKGMRIARSTNDFQLALDSARSEAKKSFGNDEMIVEKFVERPRHVEVQVFGDQHNNYVYLYERDCSVQRRHQKIIEEAPAPLISAQTRIYLGEVAVRAAQAVGYYGAGTVEFIMDPEEKIYFMEMNTRLQVEHPVSEMITNTDLVEWQLRVAQGQPLPITKQENVPLIGHAFECRVYAEDEKFMPQAGTLHYLRFPDSQYVRVETGVNKGDAVSVHYDPMIAKLCVHSHDRLAAIALMRQTLGDTRIVGMPTNIDFMNRILKHPDFVAGRVYTDFIPDREKDLFLDKDEIIPLKVLCVASAAISLFKERQDIVNLPIKAMNTNDPFNAIRHFRVNLDYKELVTLFYNEKPLNFTISHKQQSDALNLRSQCGQIDIDFETNLIYSDDAALVFNIEVEKSKSKITCVKCGDDLVVYTGDRSYTFSDAMPAYLEKIRHTGSGSSATADAVAPMPGVIDKVLVTEGDEVKVNQPMVIMVAMKMEYVISAHRDGVIERVNCKPGDSVEKNAQLVHMQETEDDKQDNTEEEE